MSDSLEACKSAAEELKRLTEKNIAIQEKNLEKNKKYAEIVEKWKAEYEKEIDDWKQKGIKKQIGKPDSYNDVNEEIKRKNIEDNGIYSLCRIGIWPGNTKDNHDISCRDRTGSENYESDWRNESSRGCRYGAGDNTGRNYWVDGCAYLCDGYKYKCVKTSSALAQEIDEYEREKLAIHSKYKNPFPPRPPELQLEEYHPLTPVICQDCSNRFNVSSSDNITVDISQINKCIAYLDQKASGEPLEHQNTPQEQSSTDNTFVSTIGDIQSQLPLFYQDSGEINQIYIIISVVIVLLFFINPSLLVFILIILAGYIYYISTQTKN
ncbi:MAG TPA: hypothetical protein V6C58_14210 [Allocoleopsis sp.]